MFVCFAFSPSPFRDLLFAGKDLLQTSSWSLPNRQTPPGKTQTWKVDWYQIKAVCMHGNCIRSISIMRECTINHAWMETFALWSIPPGDHCCWGVSHQQRPRGKASGRSSAPQCLLREPRMLGFLSTPTFPKLLPWMEINFAHLLNYKFWRQTVWTPWRQATTICLLTLFHFTNFLSSEFAWKDRWF